MQNAAQRRSQARPHPAGFWYALAEQQLLYHGCMTKQNIAVVDDDPGTCLLLEALLADAGYSVRCWPSGLAAFSEMRLHPPDLIILDLILGDDPEAGWDTLTLLRVEPPTAQIPVILMSVNDEYLRHRAHILRTKKNAMVLAKPIKADALLAQIRQALAQPR